MLDAQGIGAVRATMARLVCAEREAVNIDCCPTVRIPSPITIAKGSIARRIAPAGGCATDPQDAPRGRVEPAFLGKPFQCRAASDRGEACGHFNIQPPYRIE